MNRLQIWWENFKEWIKVPRHSGLLSLLLITAAIPVVLAASLSNTNNRQQASGNEDIDQFKSTIQTLVTDSDTATNIVDDLIKNVPLPESSSTVMGDHFLDKLDGLFQNTTVLPDPNKPSLINSMMITTTVSLPATFNSSTVQKAIRDSYTNPTDAISFFNSYRSTIEKNIRNIASASNNIRDIYAKQQALIDEKSHDLKKQKTNDILNLLKLIKNDRLYVIRINAISLKNYFGTLTLAGQAQPFTPPSQPQPKIDRVDPVDINTAHTEYQAEPLIDADEPKKPDDYQTDGYNWPKVNAVRTWCDADNNVFVNFTWNPGYDDPQSTKISGGARSKYTVVYYINGIGDTYAPLPANTTSATFNIGNVQNKSGVIKVGNAYAEYGYKHTVFTTATCTPPTISPSPVCNVVCPKTVDAEGCTYTKAVDSCTCEKKCSISTPTHAPINQFTPTPVPTTGIGSTQTQSVCVNPTITVTPLCYGNISYFNFSFPTQTNTTYTLTYTPQGNEAGAKIITKAGNGSTVNVQGPTDGVGVQYGSQWSASITTSCSSQVSVSQIVTAKTCQ